MSLKQRVPRLLVHSFCGNSEYAVGLVQSVPISILQPDPHYLQLFKRNLGGAAVQAPPVTPLLLLLPV